MWCAKGYPSIFCKDPCEKAGAAIVRQAHLTVCRRYFRPKKYQKQGPVYTIPAQEWV